MRIELINTGTEILQGQKTNTHLAFLAHELFLLGEKLTLQIAARDSKDLVEIIREAFYRSQLTIVTGGLGPTSDDMTREAVAEALRMPLIFHPQLFQKVKSFYDGAGIAAPSWAIQKQSLFLEGSLILENDHGSAAGSIIEKEGRLLIMLPGPPRELEPMWKNHVVPWWKSRFELRKPFTTICKIVGLAESVIQQRVESKLKSLGVEEIGYCESPGEVALRLLFKDKEILTKARDLMTETFGSDLYALEDKSLEEVVIEKATSKKVKIATAESCTGGLISSRLTDVPGSSATFIYGWVTYSNEAKITQLKVDKSLISSVGAVSKEVAEAMASGALEISGADLSLAVTGIAGPQGGSPEKPVGLVWVAIQRKGSKPIAYERFFPSDRLTFKRLVSQFGIDLLRRMITGKDLPKC
ncbi:CinA family nicotinamide mononucleotide deamidase-related protein [Methylacidiphilum caldifontis]|uniref:CinA-like protein n=1 Tax=Methylacidiphilum caldifontis TaxID=2795386 RepID=A0A4Y8P7W8_9BACT|nr:CinA family nicotinamide mononucleotide deamidase-related protein [Methylacidiphilum caldifontis]QSR88628.1 CinA family nicotinamide mononucleotide deamidase-related protein [Methylacidiphilum caldifontis]TFE66540.1 damage-inducible protein CinA [Methylacidiphilum caldifontis]